MAGLTEQKSLFKFWLTQGYNYRKRQSADMQRDPCKYKQRLQMEYEVVSAIPGYTDYFLIVSDLVRFAKDSGILVGPGRGSAAGSLITWLLRITEIDPLLYPMLFERFISADRTDPPDIDIDFEDERRHEVIEYAQQKYGNNKVANILNFVRYKGRNSLDDIARVYRIPEWKIEDIKSKLIERAEGHTRFSDTLQDTFDSFPEVAALVQETPVLQYATQLEGNYRNASIHPAGIVISGVPLDEICATYEKQASTRGGTQGSGIAYDKRDAAYLGLLKIDFLSLTTLTGIRATLELLPSLNNSARSMSIAEFYQIPLDPPDPKVMQAFRDGDVLGIFQFEGHTTRRVLKQVTPTKFMDLSDVNALSRPGGDDKAYLKAKNSGEPSRLSLIDERVAQHVNWTHGVIVYQEQILLILRDVGNFPPQDVNAVRKIISDKQDPTVLNEYFERFAEGAATHDISRDDARFIWQSMINATLYAFNISHSVCYSDTAYRQMWLKVNYPPQFYLGQLLKCPSDKEGLDRRRKLIIEAERHNVKVRPPDLLRSQTSWTFHQNLNGESILYAGFSAIKGIGPSIAKAIVEWRAQYGLGDGESVQDLAIDWDDLKEIPKIGPGRIKTIRDFCESDDPFDALKVKRIMDSLRKEFENGEFPGLPIPTHRSIDIDTPDEQVVYMGVFKACKYKNILEQRRKYGNTGNVSVAQGGKVAVELTDEEILENVTDPHLLKYAVLDVEDEHDEPIRVRVSRKKFPQYAGLISQAKAGKHVVVAKGYVSDFGGLSIQVSEMYLLDPEG